jgi:predicted TIM-barrel fold metal-dependent hydrolase
VRTLITSDCHIATPYSVFDELPETYRRYFPHIEARPDGDYLFQPVPPELADLMAAGSANGVKIEGDSAVRAALGATPEARASFDPSEVLADLGRDGVKGAVLIGAIGKIAISDAIPIDAELAYCHLVNDWTAEHWSPYLDRVAPGIVLPCRDVVAAVAELERCAAKGMRPALLPDGIWDLPYHLAAWEPLWEAASALKVPITMHVSGARIPPPRPGESHLYRGLDFVGWYNQCVGMGETLGWLTFTGVFERHPDLHVIMTEGYAGWLAFAIQFWDHHWNGRFRSFELLGPDLAAKLEAPPSYYLKRQAHATFMWDPMAVELRHFTGTECLLWGNDYPHREGSFPWSQQWVEKQFSDVPETDVDAIVRGNAAKLFGLSV